MKIVSIDKELNTDQKCLYCYNCFQNLRYKITKKGKYLPKVLSRNDCK